MLAYEAAYFQDDDGVHVEGLDFPGVLSYGKDIAEARQMIQSASDVEVVPREVSA